MSTRSTPGLTAGSHRGRRRRRASIGTSIAGVLALAAVLALSPAGTSAAPAVTPADPLLFWSGIAATAISANPNTNPAVPITFNPDNPFNYGAPPLRPPASSSVLGGMVHGAMYDAVAAIEGGLDPFSTGVTAPPDSSVNAAVAQAARDVLVKRVQVQAAYVESAFSWYMTAIADGPAKDAGKAVGVAAAAGMLAMRYGDHFDDNVSYVPPPGIPGAGLFEPIAPRGVTPGTPVDVKLPFVRPFTYASQSEYRPDGPVALTSKRYAKDVAELRAYGGDVTSYGGVSPRTPTQEQTVRFHTEQTFFQFNRTMRELALARGLDLRESARLLGYVNVAAADTMIACWEAKYHYDFWRPNHAIQRANTDGNPGTDPADPNWYPLVVGNHPEYPSGHACFTGAVTESLRNYFGTKHVKLVITSLASGAGGPRTYETLDELVTDVENARVWGGLHYRTTMTQTAEDFPKIARDVGKQYFLEGSKPGKGGTK